MITTMTTQCVESMHDQKPVGVASRIKVDSDVAEALPVAPTALWRSTGRAPVAWAVAAHGGAGATTLAHMLAPVGDAAAQWPAHDEYPLCVVMCRSTRTGLDAAQSAVLQAQSGHAGQCNVLGVVIVADVPGKTPKSLAQRETILEELTTVWRIPYIPGIRENDVGDLAEWNPTVESAIEPGSRRKNRKRPVTDCVPATIAEVGHDIFRAAYAASHNTRKGTKA